LLCFGVRTRFSWGQIINVAPKTGDSPKKEAAKVNIGHHARWWERTVVLTTIVLSGGSQLWLAGRAQAQTGVLDYPNRPVRLIVPADPGGIPDVFSRAMAQYLSERLGQPVVVENRPGASQAIGAEVVARSAPNGYTLFLGTRDGMVITPLTRKTLPYDPIRDFAPISMLFTSPLYLVVNAAVPATTVQELVALARSQPGKLTYGSLGVGSLHHLAAETFKSRLNLDILHVPYKGIPSALADLVSGTVNMIFGAGLIYVPYVASGKVRMLATTGLNRTEAMPNVPTMAESGLPGFDVTSWFGLWAPAGVPGPMIQRLNREVGDMLRSKATRERFKDAGIEIRPSSPDELGEHLRSDPPVWAKILRDAGIQPE
jgi:tripartite-type tricarboxylate transporter receptor subunit TctC